MAFTHTRTVQTDRSEGQCGLTEIFWEEKCLELAFEGRESSRVPDGGDCSRCGGQSVRKCESHGFCGWSVGFWACVCLTKSGGSGKDCKGVAAQKDKREQNLWSQMIPKDCAMFFSGMVEHTWLILAIRRWRGFWFWLLWWWNWCHCQLQFNILSGSSPCAVYNSQCYWDCAVGYTWIVPGQADFQFNDGVTIPRVCPQVADSSKISQLAGQISSCRRNYQDRVALVFVFQLKFNLKTKPTTTKVLCTLYLHACQVRIIVDDSGLCSCDVFWVLINSLVW